MASIQLKVTPAELQAKASDISAQIRQIELDFQKIGQAVTSSRGYWEGDASQTHQNYYSSYKDEIASVISKLKEHPEDLLKMAGLYETTENNAVQISGMLSQDVIV